MYGCMYVMGECVRMWGRGCVQQVIFLYLYCQGECVRICSVCVCISIGQCERVHEPSWHY